MPKRNFDEQAQLYEPIEFTLEGKNYTVRKLTTALLKEVDKQMSGREENDIEAAISQLALLTGEDEKNFQDLDIRVVKSVLEYITENISPEEDTKKKKGK